MAYDRSGSANLSEKEREASECAGRKRLGENGWPQARPTTDEQHAADRTKTTVKQSLKRCSQETQPAVAER
ncbi:hypothetical protein MKK69_01155 [Methylobacterium sp. J-026]|uniref:hypothetical protein n=1 Tax=Methylobacterium sp. J-026 TaxID=2836624 RepID=UPI001FB8AD82|nr:hypothetical protein [Methylobacterium sp. J-026]MCJ2132688.1 hypothetical protein [Methylobacterium sp. J-026]